MSERAWTVKRYVLTLFPSLPSLSTTDHLLSEVASRYYSFRRANHLVGAPARHVMAWLDSVEADAKRNWSEDRRDADGLAMPPEEWRLLFPILVAEVETRVAKENLRAAKRAAKKAMKN